MKMRRRILAALMCMCMIFSYGGYMPQAAEVNEEMQTTESETDNQPTEIQTTETQIIEENDSLAVTQTVEQEEGQSELTLTEESINEESSTVEAGVTGVIEYLVVGSDYVAPGEEQFVLVGLTGGKTAVSAILNYKNTSNGATYNVAASDISSEYALFFINTSILSNGVYKLESIDIQYSDVYNNINLAAEGVNASFGVNMDIDITPYGWLVDDDASVSSEDVDGVIVNDVTEGGITAADISQAIDEVGLSISGGFDDSASEASISGGESSLVVVLDPGHGGSDTGATRTYNGVTYIERDLNLKIAQACKAELERLGLTVYMTRYDNNTKPGLTERTEIAKNYGADLFISIHNNSSTNSAAYGSEVWIPNTSSYNYYTHETGEILGNKIINNLAALGLNKRGVFTRNATPDANDYYYPTGDISDYYTVINESRRRGIPGMIIEHAYVSNPSDAVNFLGSDESLRRLGVSDAQAIYSYAQTVGTEYGENSATVMAMGDGAGAYTLAAAGVPGAYKISFKVKSDVSGVTKNYDSFKSGDVWFSCFSAAEFGKTGGYTIEAYLVKASGGTTKVGETKINVKEIPSASITAFDANGEKTMILVASNVPSEGSFSKLWFNVTAPDGTTKKEYVAAKQSDGRWMAFLGIRDFRQSGTYTVTAYDNLGNKNMVIGSCTFAISTPNATSLDVKNIDKNKGTFDIVVGGVKANAGVESVRIPAWTAQDLSDLYWYTASRQSDGTYVAHANIKNHKNHYGVYAVQTLLTAQNGIEVAPISKCFNIEKPIPSVWPFDVGDNTTFIIGTENIPCSSDVAGVKVAVWHDGLSDMRWYGAMQDDLGRWLAFLNVEADYGKSGVYYADSYVVYKDGREEELGVALFRVLEPTAKSIYATNINNAGGTFDVVVSGVSCPSGIREVKIPVWSEPNLGDLHWYVASKQKDGTYKATVNISNHKGHYAGYVMQAYITSGNGVLAVPVTCGFYFAQPSSQMYAIEGSSGTTVDKMVSYYNKNATYPEFYAGTDAPTIRDFCTIYYEECQAEGIKAEVAFCQCMKETGFLKYGGDVAIEQFNFCGLGATGGGNPGNSFDSVRMGVRAHVQHLKAYASNKPLVNPCVDPRFTYVTRGAAAYVEWLGINENPAGKGWAVALRYGYSLRSDYMEKLLK